MVVGADKREEYDAKKGAVVSYTDNNTNGGVRTEIDCRPKPK